MKKKLVHVFYVYKAYKACVICCEFHSGETWQSRNMATESLNEWWNTRSLLPFSAPTTLLICGSTQSGKTHFTQKLLQNANGMFSTPVDKIIYAYSEHQPLFEEMRQTIPNFFLHQGLPSKEDIEQYTEDVKHTVVVLDDLMLQIAQSQDCVHLFTVTSHHRNVTTVMLSQNLYPPGKYARTISLNCLNVILFKNYRDSRQIITFGSQILPGKVPFFKAAYELATQPNFGYLHVCLEPKQNREYQLRSHILPGEEMVIYQPI